MDVRGLSALSQLELVVQIAASLTSGCLACEAILAELALITPHMESSAVSSLSTPVSTPFSTLAVMLHEATDRRVFAPWIEVLSRMQLPVTSTAQHNHSSVSTNLLGSSEGNKLVVQIAASLVLALLAYEVVLAELALITPHVESGAVRMRFTFFAQYAAPLP